jgi:hypothetical protein
MHHANTQLCGAIHVWHDTTSLCLLACLQTVMTLVPYSHVWKVLPPIVPIRAPAVLAPNGTMLLFNIPGSVRTAGDYRWGIEYITPTGDTQPQRILTVR